ncbi:MAG: DAK2 domain-containing protein [Ornithinimicrobium sp.]
MGSTVLDLTAARRWAVASRSLLSESREQIDRLNVFPVPDGDTGTNMFLTVDGALAELRVLGEASPPAPEGSATLGVPLRLSDGLARLAHGMLLSARGNSGVILSQLARGMSEAVQAADPNAEAMSASVLADAFARAADVAWAGVSKPIEGTILSVARAAAQGAEACVAGMSEYADPAHTYAVSLAALDAARVALARTPEQLPSLAKAGVVDAGGAGFVLVLEALESVLADRAHDGRPRSAQEWDYFGAETSAQRTRVNVPSTGELEDVTLLECDPTDRAPGETGQEVMYLLRCDEAGAEQVRAQLIVLGSSVMVVGGPDVWRVHVHLDNTAAALDAGSRFGSVQQVSITSLESPSHAQRSQVPEPLAVVCCAPGPGLARLFSAAGARVVHSAVGNRASTGVLLQAARETNASVVAVLPNDGDTVLAARAAADEGTRQGLDLRVVPTVAAVQGLAALSLWDAERSQTLESMLDEMTEVAYGMSYGALVVATASAETAAGPCRSGQWLGLAQGRIVSVNDEMTSAAVDVLARLAQVASDTAEVLTVVAGEGLDESDLDPILQTWLSTHSDPQLADLEIRRLWGGQRTYPWLLGLE